MLTSRRAPPRITATTAVYTALAVMCCVVVAMLFGARSAERGEHRPVQLQEHDVHAAIVSSPPQAPQDAVRGPSCARGEVGGVPSVAFKQVFSPHVGVVDPALLDAAMQSLASLPQHDADLRLFAVDGTLLNLLRWGRIVNDNDVDVGFYFEGTTHVMEQYHRLYRLLASAGVVEPATPKREKQLHSSSAPLKPGRCKHRGQLMQCRHMNGAYLDFFGPDTLFSNISRLEPQALVPTIPCRSFGGTFPCPADFVRVLRNLALDVRAPGATEARPTNEFGGCLLYPPSVREQGARHLTSIRASAQALATCHYPTLWSVYMAEPPHGPCRTIEHAAGL